MFSAYRQDVVPAAATVLVINVPTQASAAIGPTVPFSQISTKMNPMSGRVRAGEQRGCRVLADDQHEEQAPIVG